MIKLTARTHNPLHTTLPGFQLQLEDIDGFSDIVVNIRRAAQRSREYLAEQRRRFAAQPQPTSPGLDG